MSAERKVWIRSAPAKINLMLAITGVREDGFHDLVSLVVPVADLYDVLKMEIRSEASTDTLFCETDGVPQDASNLVLKAVENFRFRVPFFPQVHFDLKKNIPHGAGLGGGSSDAASAILLMAKSLGARAPTEDVLNEIAAETGSDCPLFLAETPVIMRGRGERIEKLSSAESAVLRAKRFLIFKPAFSISTKDIYATMKRCAPKFYTPATEAERLLKTWRENPENETLPLFNAMEAPVFRKYVALPALFNLLRERFGIIAHMSGSGSACFGEISAETDIVAAKKCIRDCWGETAFVFLSEDVGKTVSLTDYNGLNAPPSQFSTEFK